MTREAYIPQEWQNKNPSYTLSDVRMLHIENGIEKDEAFCLAIEELLNIERARAIAAEGKLARNAGDLIGGRVTTPPESHILDLRDGTAASPVKIGVSYSYSRVDATTRAEVNEMGPTGTDGPDGATALRAAIKGLASSEVQIVALYASAWQTGESGLNGNDACPIYGLSRVTNNATGRAIGGYIESSRETATSNGQQALELRVKNQTGVSDSYTPSAPSKSMGMWINAGGNARSGAAYQIGFAFGQQFDVGYAANTGSILSSFMRDDSNAATSVDIRGKHAKGAIIVANEAGAVLVGGSTQLSSGSLLELQATTTLDPVFRISSTSSVALSQRIINSNGSLILGVAGTANQLAKGTVGGDIVLRTGAAERTLYIGGTENDGTSRPVISVNQVGIAVNGNTPIGKATAISTPAETLEGHQAAILSLKAAIQAFGITA